MSRPKRILFLTDNFPPEGNAPAIRTYEHCREWVKAGLDVTVITCHPNFPKGKIFPGHKNKLVSREILDGIKVIRVWSFITPNRGTVKRILDYLSFAFSSLLVGLFYKTDLIIATSPQLFTALSGYGLSVLKRKPWVMEVRDLWPESIVAVDAMNESKGLKKLQSLVNFLYRKSDQLVVVTDAFKDRISKDGIDPEKIRVVKNGVNLVKFEEYEPHPNLATSLNLKDKFLVGYIGTHGMAHNLDFILDCAKNIEDPEIHLLFVGDGALKGRLEKRVQLEAIGNVTMLEAISSEKVPAYIDLLDVALIPLKKTDTFKSVIPSKIFENAAMQKPILLGVEGEAKEIVTSYKAGLCFEPENERDFIRKLQQLKADEKLYEECRIGGKRLAEDFRREKLASRMLAYLDEVLVSKKSKLANARNPNERLKIRLAKILDILLLTLILLVVIFIALV